MISEGDLFGERAAQEITTISSSVNEQSSIDFRKQRFEAAAAARDSLRIIERAPGDLSVVHWGATIRINWPLNHPP